MIDRIGKDDPRLPIAVRILLPVEEVIGRADLERIIGHRGPAMGGGAQPHDLRAEFDGPTIAVASQVMEGCFDHGLEVTLILLQCNRIRIARPF